MKINYEIHLTEKENDRIEKLIKEYLSTPDSFSKQAWFKSPEEAEEVMGDWFFDALDFYTECLGVHVILEADDGKIQRALEAKLDEVE